MTLRISQPRNESIIDRYNDMRIQNTMTTVVAPIVSLFVGNDTFFNSLRTPSINSRTEVDRTVQTYPLSFQPNSH